MVLLEANPDLFTNTYTSCGNSIFCHKKWTPLSLWYAGDQLLPAAAPPLCCHFKDIRFDLHNFDNFVDKHFFYRRKHASHTHTYIQAYIHTYSIVFSFFYFDFFISFRWCVRVKPVSAFISHSRISKAKVCHVLSLIYL